MSNLDLIDYYRNKIALVLLYCSITVSVFFFKMHSSRHLSKIKDSGSVRYFKEVMIIT